jgi:hypothetical protein
MILYSYLSPTGFWYLPQRRYDLFLSKTNRAPLSLSRIVKETSNTVVTADTVETDIYGLIFYYTVNEGIYTVTVRKFTAVTVYGTVASPRRNAKKLKK